MPRNQYHFKPSSCHWLPYGQLGSMLCSACAVLRPERKQPINCQTDPGVDYQPPVKPRWLVASSQGQDRREQKIDRIATEHGSQ